MVRPERPHNRPLGADLHSLRRGAARSPAPDELSRPMGQRPLKSLESMRSRLGMIAGPGGELRFRLAKRIGCDSQRNVENAGPCGLSIPIGAVTRPAAAPCR